jgi:ABC transporter substrate binding protein
MRRREFIAGLGGAVTWPFAARAQQPALPVIGWPSARPSKTDEFLLPAFRKGLSAQGYVEGRNVAIEYRWGDGRLVRLVSDAAEFVRRRVAIVVAPGTGMEAMQAAQAAGSTIPIVFVVGNDPVERGLVPNLNRPAAMLRA